MGVKGRLLGLWLFWALMLPVGARADGCFIPATAFARVEIPDQRALVHFAYGTETLVIDSAIKGDGTSFAWIIPVPSVPSVEPASTGLFPTLQTLFQPEVVHDPFEFYWAAIVLGVIIFTILRNIRRGESGLARLSGLEGAPLRKCLQINSGIY